MSFVKMTDILVSTSAFIVTLAYSAKAKSEIDMSTEAVLEVTPIIQSATNDVGLAEKLFDVLIADSSANNRRMKDHALQSFIKSCNKKVFEQFWDSSNWGTLETLSTRMPTITCMLYDKEGSLVHMITCSAIDIMRALKRIEEAFFISTRSMPLVAYHHDKKDFRRDQNRSTHKYFMHHRSR